MLIDDLIADGAPGSGCDMACLIPSLRTAQKFTLSQDFAAVADALSIDYTGLVKAFEHCRLPYPVTWIELAHAERATFANAEMQAPMFQVTPKRIGYLLTATSDDLSAWKAHLFWSTDKGCSAPALAMKFDMKGEVDNCKVLPTQEDMDRTIEELLVLSHVGSHPGWDEASDTVKLTMLNHTTPIMPDYGMPSPKGVPFNRLGEYYRAIADLSRSDWAGEPAYLLAVIALLNARNAVEIQSVDHSKLNRARIKRGKPSLFEHKILKIAQRQVNRIYGEDGARGDYAPMRGHFVRGHFKTRRTGIFFWHPHARGSFKRGHIEKDYQLT